MTRYEDPDEALRQIEQWGEVARDQEARATALQTAAQAVCVDQWSTARDVRVVVDASGLMQDLELTERALGASSLQLGRTIVAALSAARSALAVRLDEVAEEIGGPQDAALVASFRDQHVQILRSSAAPPSDGEAQRPVLR